MLGFDQSLLINLLGHTAGALIFAIFLVLLFSRRGWSGARGRYLSGLAAALSLAWNAGSLLILVWPAMPDAGARLVVAFSFSALSLIPAVLLHVSLGQSRRLLVAAGYLLSAVAAAMHFREVQSGANLHQAALAVITIGFLVLTAAAVADHVFLGGGPRVGARIAASMCLALFAMSFVHFGADHAGQAWSAELFVHHAGIPLALFLLLQDYRFVLLDAFVRFLANALLAAVLTWLVIRAAFRFTLVERVATDPLHEAELLVSICLLLVVFAWLRNRIQLWLAHALFRHGGLADLPRRVQNGPEFSGEKEYLAWAAGEIAAAVHTSQFVLDSGDENAADRPPDWAEATVAVRLGPGRDRRILLGRRSGGRRYLGEDLDALARAAAQIEEKLLALRRREMDRLVNQAELRALQSQINPHFLFNALNALYGTIPRTASDARRLVLNLADIFRYFLQTERSFVTLAEEVEIVRAYLEVETLRLGSRLQVEIDVEEPALALRIPVLSVQPLVENAIKHGIALRTGPGYVRFRGECREGELRISIANTRPEAPVEREQAGAGVGLQNVRRRLEICYGSAASLALTAEGTEALAVLRVPASATAAAAQPLAR
jgi:two-component system, LytTR family, sensor kinase